MDELSRKSRLARRLALAATICCTATCAIAETPNNGSGQSQSLRGLLSQGWNRPATSVKEVAETPAPKREVVETSPTQEGVSIIRPRTRIVAVPVPVLEDEDAARPSRSILSLCEEEAVKQETAQQQSHVAVESAPVEANRPLPASSLAELIKRQAKPIIVPKWDGEIASSAAPSVKRLTVEEQVAAREAKLREQPVTGRVQAARPIQSVTKKRPLPPSSVASLLKQHGGSEAANDQQQHVVSDVVPEISLETPSTTPKVVAAKSDRKAATAGSSIVAVSPTIAKTPETTASPTVAQEPTLAKTSESATLKVETTVQQVAPVAAPEETAPSTKVAVKPKNRPEATPTPKTEEVVEAKVAEAKKTVLTPAEPASPSKLSPALSEITAKPFKEEPLVHESATTPLPSPESLADSQSEEPLDLGEVSLLDDRSRRVAADDGFSLLPLKSFEPVLAGSLRPNAPSSLTATIHVTRLRESARESLQNARHRLERRATHSAKKYTLDALRTTVAMRDAQSGGNRHAKQLAIAFNAIRESEDFCGRFGAVDSNALIRMVNAHETTVLKGLSLEHISALEATESYLEAARRSLVLACEEASEASDALVLLGMIEKQLAGPDQTHAAAVAVTLQRAAVEIAPDNALGYRELGSTLLQQGLVEQASWALNRSVELHPSRGGYKRLLEASRRLGDADTARVCLASLNDPDMPPEIPVRQLSLDAFKTTHRPAPAAIAQQEPTPKQPEPTTSSSKPTKVSLRSLFPFGRR